MSNNDLVDPDGLKDLGLTLRMHKTGSLFQQQSVLVKW